MSAEHQDSVMRKLFKKATYELQYIIDLKLTHPLNFI